MKYYYVNGDGNVDFLEHGYKYIKREKINGKWRYWYEDSDSQKDRSKTHFSQVDSFLSTEDDAREQLDEINGLLSGVKAEVKEKKAELKEIEDELDYYRKLYKDDATKLSKSTSFRFLSPEESALSDKREDIIDTLNDGKEVTQALKAKRRATAAAGIALTIEKTVDEIADTAEAGKDWLDKMLKKKK